MSRHDFDSATFYCRFCGISKRAAFSANVDCWPDSTNLVALKPFLARRRLNDEMGLGKVVDAFVPPSDRSITLREPEDASD